MAFARNAALFLVLLPTCLGGWAQQPAIQGLPDTSDFPEQDNTAASVWLRGVEAKRTEELLGLGVDSIESLVVLLDRGNVDEALDVLEQVADERFESLARYLEPVRHDLRGLAADRASPQAERFARFLASVQERLPTVTREQAAMLEFQLAPILSFIARLEDRQAASPLEGLVAKYPGTAAADLAQLDLIQADRADYTEMFARLDGVASANPGTCLAVRALKVRGQELSFNVHGSNYAPRGTDPTNRLLEILAIADRIASEEFAGCADLDRQELAAELAASGWFPDDAPISRDNLERLIAAHVEVAVRLLQAGPVMGVDSHFDVLATHRLPGFARRLDGGFAEAERVLDTVEERAPAPAAFRLLRARRYLSLADATEEHRNWYLTRAREVLTSVLDDGPLEHSRRALAALAALAFQRGHDGEALDLYGRFIRLYPASGWTWVARLRIGQLHEVAGDLDSALALYEEVARVHAKVNPAVVLAHQYAARVSMALGQVDAALAQQRLVLDSWDQDFGWYALGTRRDNTPGDDPSSIEKEGMQLPRLIEEVERMEWTLDQAGGAAAERAYWYLEHDRYEDAIAALAITTSAGMAPDLRAWADYLLHRARLFRALDAGDVERPEAYVEEALADLDELASGSWDPAVSVARMAQAAELWRRSEARAEQLTREALASWVEHQAGWPGNRPTTSGYEADVRAIRDAVFLPQGGGLYHEGGGNAFSWPETLPPFLLLNPRIQVRLSDGQERYVRVYDPVPGYDNVAFVEPEHQQMLSRLLARLGGTNTREPRWVMETPNQPVGGSMAILALWNKFFAARPGHWSGWVFATYPHLGTIEFLDEERTRAHAHVTIGYGGTAVVMEKIDGTWTPVRLSGRWVT